MADFVYNEAKKGLAGTYSGIAGFDFEAPDDFRISIECTNTTAGNESPGAEKDIAINLDDFVTGDEYVGTGYGRKTIDATETLTVNTAADTVEYDSTATITYTSIVANTNGRNAQAIIFYRHIDGTDANDLLFAHIDSGGQWIGNGGNVTIDWNASGIINFTD